MQKLFDAGVDYPLVLVAPNEEFPRAQTSVSNPGEQVARNKASGWNAYEIWHSRIRLSPGVISLFQPRRYIRR
jgi:hypothetical protein